MSWSLNTDPIHQTVATRAPAAWLAVAAMCGITADRLLTIPATVGITLALVAGLVALAVRRFAPRGMAVLLLCGWTALFAAWHHRCWYDQPADSVAGLLHESSLPVALRGRIVEPCWNTIRRDQSETTTTLSCTAVRSAAKWQPLSGRVRMIVTGATPEWSAGTEIDVLGRLVEPRPALNPGDFDYRDWLRAQGISAVLRVESANAVTVQQVAPTWSDRLTNLRRELRQHAQAALQRSRFSTTPAVAEALLLGTRTQLPPELREAFIESGTLHVLAISGVNVGVIWLGLVRGARALGMSLRSTTFIVLTGLAGYAWLTDANPPIIRAVTFAALFQSADLVGRRMGALQGLSLTLVLMLAWNPSDLFNPGAQLSFLSVAALSQVMTWWPPALERDSQDLSQTAWQRWWRGFLQWMWQANVTTAAVWFVTLPLVLWRFHLFSPVGFVLNVALGAYVWMLLWTGYAWLVALAVTPWASPAALWAFELLLQGLVRLTQAAAAWESGHWYVAGPPGWWVAGYYGLLAWGVARGRFTWRPLGLLALAWVNVGLAVTLIPATRNELTCDVLGVGHGLAVVVEMPSGAVLVYDAGSLGNADHATEAVCQALWQRGRRRLDALLISHADSDHCNATPELTERLSCGTLLLHETFLRSPTPTAAAVVESWRHRGEAGRLVFTGDRLTIDPRVRIEVLHPPAGFRGERDNSNSVVLLVEYAGRRLLLTGDLERDGLAALLDQPRRPADLVVAPHHGSRAANPPLFAAWCAPQFVAVSALDRRVVDRIQDHYGAAPVFNTAQCGRIRCVIRSDGDLNVSTFR